MTIAELLNGKEGENVEFKEMKNSFEFDIFVKYVCAVSNHGGGRVVFGITDAAGSRLYANAPEYFKVGRIFHQL